MKAAASHRRGRQVSLHRPGSLPLTKSRARREPEGVGPPRESLPTAAVHSGPTLDLAAAACPNLSATRPLPGIIGAVGGGRPRSGKSPRMLSPGESFGTGHLIHRLAAFDGGGSA